MQRNNFEKSKITAEVDLFINSVEHERHKQTAKRTSFNIVDERGKIINLYLVYVDYQLATY